jgi:hypothetical protein
MKIIDLNDSKIKSELPKSIALKDNLNLLIFCSNHECGSHKFFSNIVINTHDELENFKIFWNSRKK